MPLSEFDGCRVLRVRVHRPGGGPVVNQPFYVLPDGQYWGDDADVYPPLDDEYVLEFVCGACVRADGSPIPEWLLSGRDPWLTAAQDLAAREGRRLVY